MLPRRKRQSFNGKEPATLPNVSNAAPQRPEAWDPPAAEARAAVYASNHSTVLEDVRNDENLKEALRAYMRLHGLDELIDGETGLGVRFGPPASNVTWDTTSMPDALLLALKARGLVTIHTSIYDELRRKADARDLLDAAHYRITGEKAPPLLTVQRG